MYFSTVDDRILAAPRASGDDGAVTVIAAEGVRAAGGLGLIGDRLYWTNTATAANGGSVRWACRANPTAADPSDRMITNTSAPADAN